MYDTTLTIAGNLVDDPRMRLTRNGHAITTFRVASTSRRFDREQGTFVNNATLFVNVTCWRGLAENAYKSLRKGQPVVVTGRYMQREYELNDALKVVYVLEASSLGHDLARGTTTFERVDRAAVTDNVALDDQGIPSNETEHIYDLADESPVEFGVSDDRSFAAVS
jgi:single-strand DNA-binding protein